MSDMNTMMKALVRTVLGEQSVEALLAHIDERLAVDKELVRLGTTTHSKVGEAVGEWAAKGAYLSVHATLADWDEGELQAYVLENELVCLEDFENGEIEEYAQDNELVTLDSWSADEVVENFDPAKLLACMSHDEIRDYVNSNNVMVANETLCAALGDIETAVEAIRSTL